MQRNEIIIEQFIKTIKGSSADVKGDPMILNRVFEALEKKKRRKKLLGFFFIVAVVVTGTSIIVLNSINKDVVVKETKGFITPSKISMPKFPVAQTVVAEVPEEKQLKVKPVKKIDKTTNKKQDPGFENVVTYKFKDHQVDVFQNGEEEFIQINVFGADGEEQDVLKIMEDLKKSYKNNSVYVDSVKHK